MNVKELKALLDDYPAEAEVMIWGNSDGLDRKVKQTHAEVSEGDEQVVWLY